MKSFCTNRRRTGFWIAIAVAIAVASSVGHHSGPTDTAASSLSNNK